MSLITHDAAASKTTKIKNFKQKHHYWSHLNSQSLHNSCPKQVKKSASDTVIIWD